MKRLSVAALSLSAAGLIGIAVSEGWRDTTYIDAVGVPTVGFGSTEGVKPGQRLTVERGLILLGSDVGKHERELRECLGDTPMAQHEWDATVSWAFNVGVRCDSTLIRKFKAGDYAGACAEFSKWVYAGGRKLPGLVKRRAEERARCEGR